jgi:hypothetical protein
MREPNWADLLDLEWEAEVACIDADWAQVSAAIDADGARPTEGTRGGGDGQGQPDL